MIVNGDNLTGNTTGRTNSTTPLTVPDGSTLSPALSFASDNDTGLYKPVSNGLGFVTGGTEKLRVDDSGQQSSVVPGGTTLLPLFGCRAWVNFHGVQSGTLTYTISGNTVTVTQSSHGMSSGAVANLTFSTGTVSGTANYTVTVVNDNSYTVTSAVSGSTGGNVVRNTFMRGFGNVSGVLRNATGDYTITFTTAMPDANYVLVGTTGTTIARGIISHYPGATYLSSSCRIFSVDTTITSNALDQSIITVVVFR